MAYDKLEMASQQVLTFEGDDVRVEEKNKSLRKFGRKTDLGAAKELVSNLPGEPAYLSTDAITSVVSSDASDTEVLTVEGHTIVGTDLTFVVQTVTLTGQTPVLLGTPLARATRAYNAGGVELVGAVAVYEGGAVTAGVPDVADEVHLQLLAGEQQSFHAATSIAATDYFFITELLVSVLKAQSRNVDFFLEIRRPGGVWRPVFEIEASSTGSSSVDLQLDPVITVPANSDVRVTAASSGTSTEVAAYFAGYLAKVIV